jgi:hypothetical protein
MFFIGGFLSNTTLIERIIIVLMITTFILGVNDNMSSVILAITAFSIVESVIERMYNNKKTK